MEFNCTNSSGKEKIYKKMLSQFKSIMGNNLSNEGIKTLRSMRKKIINYYG